MNNWYNPGNSVVKVLNLNFDRFWDHYGIKFEPLVNIYICNIDIWKLRKFLNVA